MEKYAENYLKIQIEKISFMNEESANEYKPHEPKFGNWTVVDTFVSGMDSYLYGDKNPHDTRWMRKFYYEQVWGDRVNELLEPDSYDELEKMDYDSWQTMMENNYYVWLTNDMELLSSNTLNARENWESGKFLTDIAGAALITTATIVTFVEVAPIALAFGDAAMTWLGASGTVAATQFNNFINNTGNLVTNTGVIMNNGLVANDALVAAQQAQLEMQLILGKLAELAASDPDALARAYEAMTSFGSGSSGNVPGGAGKGVIKASPYELQPTHSQTLSNNQFNKLVNDIKTRGIQEPIK